MKADSESCDALSAIAQRAVDLASEVMGTLCDTRPVFHTEADFQHAFAWECRQREPSAQVRLERRFHANSNERLDLLLCFGGLTVAVELKYPLAALDADVNGERFVLREQSAIDRMRFSFVCDIKRLERLVSEGVADVGIAIVLTNVLGLWEVPRDGVRPAADAEFRLHEGRNLVGRVAWSGAAKWWRKEGLPAAIELAGSYPMRWSDYSNVNDRVHGNFRWMVAVVA